VNTAEAELYSSISLGVEGPVATLRLTRPEIRNALSGLQMIDELTDALVSVRDDPNIVVLIVTGEGDAFSAGGDLRDMRQRSGLFAGDTPDEVALAYRTGIQRVPKVLATMNTITIAAVNGPAIGAGCDLALMCDLRIAARDAVFAESFVKIGLISGDGGAWFLPRIVGMQRAIELLVTGRTISADEAVAIGMVLETVPREHLLSRAGELARQISRNGPAAVRLMKRLLMASPNLALEPFLDVCAEYQGTCQTSDEHRAALSHLLDRRP